MADPAERLQMTPDEYLAYERASLEGKHEYVGGEIFAMAGASRRHNLIAANLTRELGNALIDRPCEVYPSDMRVGAVDRSYRYPDVSVVCDEPRFEGDKEDVLLNPSLVVEVLSDSTEAYDRGDKFAHYRSIDSLRDYVLVSQHIERVEHFHRLASGEWRYRALGAGDALRLDDHNVTIPVARIYTKVFREE